MNEKLKVLERNETWQIIPLPHAKKIVGCKWVFKIKYNCNETVDRYKARLVAKSYTQTYGLDYVETFALVAKINIIRVLFSIAVNQGWKLHQLDVKNAFLQGTLKKKYI
jgi:Reverse transcriptase (RNA-dependent DNA polymerase)